MLEAGRINAIVGDAARKSLKARSVLDVLSSPSTDSEGRDALLITIVVTPTSAANLGGDAALNTVVLVQNELAKAGELRLPLIEFSTKKELAAGGGS